jgi:hypothetical protein
MTNMNNSSAIKNNAVYRFIRKSGKSIRRNVKRFFLKRKLLAATPVFVFQMGKVASSSIFDSLKKQYPGAVGHAHHIGEDNWMSVLFYELAKSGKKLKIISPVRDPVSRNISDFFQMFEDYTGVDVDSSKLDQETMEEKFLNNYDHTFPLTWFDTMIHNQFGINVYATPFPKSGHATYENNNVSLLVFRIDLPDEEKETVIRDFLDFPDFNLYKSNISSDKKYNDLYTRFRNNLTLSDQYLDMICSSRYFQHFFTPDEIGSIRERWSKKAPSN